MWNPEFERQIGGNIIAQYSCVILMSSKEEQYSGHDGTILSDFTGSGHTVDFSNSWLHNSHLKASYSMHLI